MIKLENVEVSGWEAAIRGMRNPMNSWEKSDSYENYTVDYEKDEITGEVTEIRNQYYRVGAGDIALMKKLTKAGTDHRKFLRMLPVTVDITAPLYWIAELDTYKIATVRNSCSFMHKGLAKEFELSDFDTKSNLGKQALIQVIYTLNELRQEYLKTKDDKIFEQIRCLLPSGYLQRFTWFANYEVLLNIYYARKNHKLSEWHDFCDWIKKLPFMDALIGE